MHPSYTTKLSKIYFFQYKNGNAYIKDGIYGDATLLYEVNEKHQYLIDLYIKLHNSIDYIDTLFIEYINMVIKDDQSKLTKYNELKNTLKMLHPFLYNETALTTFLLIQIADYFTKSFLFLIKTYYRNEPASSIVENINNAFISAVSPITSNKFLISTLWGKIDNYVSNNIFRYPIQSLTEAIIEKQQKSIDLSEQYTLESLHELYSVLNFFLYTHSDIYSTNKEISIEQSTILFLGHPTSAPFISYLNNYKCIDHPSDIIDIFISNREQNETDEIMIATRSKKFSSFSDNAYYYLSKNELSSELSDSLNNLIPPSTKYITQAKIYEFNYFEQLIYFEIYQLLIFGYFSKICNNPQCNNLFITNHRKNRYCHKCRNRKAHDSTYRSNLSRFDKIRLKIYHQKYYNCTKITDLSIRAEEKQHLSIWNSNAKKYIMSNSDKLSTLSDNEIIDILNKI